MQPAQPLGIYFRNEAYSETTSLRSGDPLRPQGLMGREVASHNFLQALLKHGNWSVLEAILNSEADRSVFTEACKRSLSDSAVPRRVRITLLAELAPWLAAPPAKVVHFPNPPDSQFALTRQSAGANLRKHSVAFSGVTHTLCSQPAIEALWNYLHGPWRSYDRLVCTSQAVMDMVRSTTEAMREHLLSHHGLATQLHLGLELIPLGVCTSTHRPATHAERYEARRRLGVAFDRLILLFVGRLSHHSKAQPHAMFMAAQRAAEASGKEVVLLQCGWFANDVVREAYESTARRVAPDVRLITVDGLDPWWRQHVWDAADVFISLADSIQETFGLTVIEAMAHGLPVVASDWNGYRDTILHDETGFLVPTRMVQGTLASAPAQLVASEITYDHFLAIASQAVEVSVDAASRSLATLATNAELRKRLGEAGRRRAEQAYSWPTVIAAYQAMWQAQREELDAANEGKISATAKTTTNQPRVFYPPVETCFRGYPTHWIECTSHFVKTGNVDQLRTLLNDPLVNHSVPWRDSREEIVDAYENWPKHFSLKDISQTKNSHPPELVSWLLKYGVITASDGTSSNPPWVTFVTTCMGRLADLQATLPVLLRQDAAAVVVVDYSCPQQSGAWARQQFPIAQFPQLHIVSVSGATRFDRSVAKNTGVRASKTPWVCLIDADIIPADDFAEQLRSLAQPHCIVRSAAVVDGTGGTFLFEREWFDAVGGHDPLFQGWGEQDEDLVDALQFAGAKLNTFAASLLKHRDHDDAARTQYHADQDRRRTQLINRLYRAAKWDWARVIQRPLEEHERSWLRHEVEQQLSNSQDVDSITIQLGAANWPLLDKTCRRELRYSLAKLSG